MFQFLYSKSHVSHEELHKVENISDSTSAVSILYELDESSHQRRIIAATEFCKKFVPKRVITHSACEYIKIHNTVNYWIYVIIGQVTDPASTGGTLLQPHYSDMLQQLHNPLSIANLLFAEGKIDEKSLNEVQSKLSQEEKTRALFKLVLQLENVMTVTLYGYLEVY